MAAFQLILLSERERPVRNAPDGTFSLIQFRGHMGAAIPPPGLAANTFPDPSWLLPGDALARVEAIIGERRIAIDTLLGPLKAGRLAATYKGASWENAGQKYALDPNNIDPKFWRYYHNYHESTYVWKTSQLKLFLGSYDHSLTHDNVYLTFFEVRLKREGIEAIIANLPATIPNKASPAKLDNAKSPKGGRPPKAWWDDFWIEICRQIWLGDLKPKTQADLTRAMFEWVENHTDGKVEETTIKDAARKLFKAWDLGSKT